MHDRVNGSPNRAPEGAGNAIDRSARSFTAAARRLISSLVILTCTPTLADEPLERLFENSVRPLLVERCLRCHGSQEQENALRLDSRQAMLKGGESGPAIVPGQPAKSLLIQAVRHQNGLEMPPEKPLSPPEIVALEQWIQLGAKWPSGVQLASKSAATHWAFQPVKSPVVPERKTEWGANEIDSFVWARLQKAKLSPAPKADRRTLIRRVTYTLTGLPPSAEEVKLFVNDPDPQAYEKLVDRLLASPRYGEHWARHWLDVARYSDTKGYVYAREERFWVHAWSYRDWVVRSLNDDLPYDRFLLLQLAADQVQDRQEGDLAAMGYLTLGRRFLGVKRDIIDDRIDVVSRGMMALTVGCARCHDHKYDPIPTADYYSLYGVFDSSVERIIPLQTDTLAKSVQQEFTKRQQAHEAKLKASLTESSQRVRQRLKDYLHAQTELEKFPAQGFDQVFEKDDLLPSVVRRFASFLHDAKRERHPAFRHWHAYQAIPAADFASRSAEVTTQLNAATSDINPLVQQAFATPPKSFEEVIETYTNLLNSIDKQWQKEKQPDSLADPHAESLRRVLYGPSAPAEVPAEPVVHTESFFTTSTCTALWKTRGEVDRYLIQQGIPAAVVLEDRHQPSEPRIFVRGNPLRKGENVPRRFLSVLTGPNAKPFSTGSGRRELAEAIISPTNPLTARVIVNRVWGHHFGAGLVTTPSDFGLRATPPSHPELLDWLTAKFVADGWSLKNLHRLILQSATFQQSSTGPARETLRQQALEVDPENRLLWRMNAHRLTFEELRDSMLSVTGRLQHQTGGKPTDLFKQPYPTRRTLYCLVDRQFLPGTLRVFDFANPDLHIARRNETTVPQQMLFFLNHPIVIEQAKQLALQTERESPLASEQIRHLFRHILQREATATELEEAIAFLRAASDSKTPQVKATVNDWQYGYGAYDEKTQRVMNFQPLPHYTGSAWQGGSAWPDAKLGWVQLTANGGHPGNTRQHASVRRWVAPRDMQITLESKLIHEAAPGDGIRAFLVSSQTGLLNQAAIHQKTIDMNLATFNVKQGETIDFVVDIGDVLNSDQYLWTGAITELNVEAPTVWNSETDFTPPAQDRLSSLEQLVHVLLCTNEFLFVD